MLTDLAAFAFRFAPWGFAAGSCLILAGTLWLFFIRRPAPTPLPAKQPAPIVPALPVEPNYHRADADTRVIPCIPGATRKDQERTEEVAGPRCPTCGGPFGACACVTQKCHDEAGGACEHRPPLACSPTSADESRRVEGRVFDSLGATQEIEPAESALTVRIPPYALTWPQFPSGLELPTVVLRQLDGPSVEQLDQLAAKHRAPDLCPLTTDEVPDIALAESTPWIYEKERWETVDLSAKTQKIPAAAS